MDDNRGGEACLPNLTKNKGFVKSLKDTIKRDAPAAVRLYDQLKKSARDIKAALNGADGRTRISEVIKNQTGLRVQTGPFVNMRLVDKRVWGDGDIAAKLLGVYEQDLHDALELVTKRQYGAVVDIGCAEGYYAVGVARLLPDCPVYAFDPNPKALALTEEAGSINGVRDRIRLCDLCSPGTLVELARKHTPLLVISDCEGYELQLFSHADVILALREADLIIECHDFVHPGCTETLRDALRETHCVEIICAGGRNPNVFPFLSHFGDAERWEAICENRPCLMNWLFCESTVRLREGD